MNDDKQPVAFMYRDGGAWELAFADDKGELAVPHAQKRALYASPAHTESAAPVFDMLSHLARQREFSERTFGPGTRTASVIDHIRKELREIEADPTDLSEWADVVILALDGFWRAGASPQQIIDTIVAKQTKNEARVWPDWRTMPADKAIEHDRSHDAAAPSPVSGADERAAFEITEQMAADWADRNELENVLTSFSTQRNAIEDARTLHLIAATPTGQQALSGAAAPQAVALTDEQIEAEWFKAAGHGIASGRLLDDAKRFARALLAGSA